MADWRLSGNISLGLTNEKLHYWLLIILHLDVEQIKIYRSIVGFHSALRKKTYLGCWSLFRVKWKVFDTYNDRSTLLRNIPELNSSNVKSCGASGKHLSCKENKKTIEQNWSCDRNMEVYGSCLENFFSSSIWLLRGGGGITKIAHNWKSITKYFRLSICSIITMREWGRISHLGDP